MNSEHDKLLTDWFRRARESQLAHYACSNYFSRLNLFLGIPTIVLSTIVGTAVFVSMDNSAIGNYKIAIGMVSMLASVLAALHTFLGFSQRDEKHKLTASGYASIRRELELMKSFNVEEEKELEKKFEAVKQRMDHLAESSEEVPDRIWRKVVGELKHRPHERIFHLPGKNG